MKELYISPELEILCFLPTQGIASMFGQNGDLLRTTTNDGPVISTGESMPGDYNDPVEGEDLFG